MIGYKPTASSQAASRVSPGAQQAIDAHLARFTSTEAASANIVAAFAAPKEESPPFNPHPTGSDAWYRHGLDTGFWINGRTTASVTQHVGDSDDIEMANHVMGELATRLQALNDEFAYLVSAGVSQRDVAAIARATLPGNLMRDRRLSKTATDSESKAARFAGLYNQLQVRHGVAFVDDVIDDLPKQDMGVQGRVATVRDWGQTTLQRMRAFAREEEIAIPDHDERRADLFGEIFDGHAEISRRISSLPWTQQADAWAYYNAAVDAELDRVGSALDRSPDRAESETDERFSAKSRVKEVGP